jgi:hypothetical protein
LEGPAQSYTNYFDEIFQQNSTTWDVYLGPCNYCYSSSNPMQPNLLRTGTEEDPQYEATSCSESSSLDWEDATHKWHADWSDSSHSNAYTEQDNPPYANWVTQNAYVQDWAGGSEPSGEAYTYCFPSGAANVSPTSLPSSPTNTGPTNSPSSPAGTDTPLTETQISQTAHKYAAAMGDPNPSSIEHVESTRQQAVAVLSGDKVSTNPDVYAIVMRGQFVDNEAPLPGDATAPSGSVLTIIINATTGQLTDLGVQNQVPDLTSLGPVTTDQ